MKKITALITILLFGLSAVHAQTNTQIKTLTNNLKTPWEILWGPDDMILMTERGGKVSRVNPENGAISEIISISEVAEVGEGGLLGMAIDPDFSSNNFFYIAYNYYAPGNAYREKIVRFTFNPANGKAGSPFVLLDNISGASNHNGCRMIISPDKKLIFSTGDAQNTSNSQNLKSLSGKILRINLDGTIPQDNPLANSLIWSWGHRNPQGLAYSPDGKTLYSSEHGPNNDDELNIIVKGRNYGWPNVEGFCDTNLEKAFCSDSNVVEPIFAWTPTLAVAGLAFYDSGLIPELKNSLLLTSLKAGKLIQLRLNENGTKVIESKDLINFTYGRLRDICISPEGKIYLATSNRDGRGSPNADDDRILEISVVSTSVSESKMENKISVFPNPAKDFVTITFSETLQTNASYSLYNMNGQLLKTGILHSNPSKLMLPTNYEGLLMLHLNTDNQNFIEKIMINN